MSYLDDQRLILRQERFRARIDDMRHTWGLTRMLQSANAQKPQPANDTPEEREHKSESEEGETELERARR